MIRKCHFHWQLYIEEEGEWIWVTWQSSLPYSLDIIFKIAARLLNETQISLSSTHSLLGAPHTSSLLYLPLHSLPLNHNNLLFLKHDSKVPIAGPLLPYAFQTYSLTTSKTLLKCHLTIRSIFFSPFKIVTPHPAYSHACTLFPDFSFLSFITFKYSTQFTYLVFIVCLAW